jgi:hypothetical protein
MFRIKNRLEFLPARIEPSRRANFMLVRSGGAPPFVSSPKLRTKGGREMFEESRGDTIIVKFESQPSAQRQAYNENVPTTRRDVKLK